MNNLPQVGDIWQYKRSSVEQTFLVSKSVIDKGFYHVFSGILLERGEYTPTIFFTPGDVRNGSWTKLA